MNGVHGVDDPSVGVVQKQCRRLNPVERFAVLDVKSVEADLLRGPGQCNGRRGTGLKILSVDRQLRRTAVACRGRRDRGNRTRRYAGHRNRVGQICYGIAAAVERLKDQDIRAQGKRDGYLKRVGLWCEYRGHLYAVDRDTRHNKRGRASDCYRWIRRVDVSY